jgi:hypothetical protein
MYWGSDEVSCDIVNDASGRGTDRNQAKSSI